MDEAILAISNFQVNYQHAHTSKRQPAMSVERPVTWSDSDMQATVTKLLDKAGSDPRLTPRILREKAEQRMNLLKGDLKPNRERIKDIIYEWWRVRKSAEEDRENSILKSLVKLARVSGNVPAALKNLSDLPTNTEKINTLRERLRAKGLKFSDVPTESEMAAAEKEYKLRQDLDGIDTSLIVNTSRNSNSKRAADATSTTSSSSSAATASLSSAKQQKVSADSSASVVKAEKGAPAAAPVKVEGGGGASSNSGESVAAKATTKVKAEYSDEEAEF